MDPFTLELDTFGVQKLRCKSTKRALRDAASWWWLYAFSQAAGAGMMQIYSGVGIGKIGTDGLSGISLLGTPQ